MITVRPAENGLELWLHFSTDNLEQERTLSPAEARALAAELVSAAREIEYAESCKKCYGSGDVRAPFAEYKEPCHFCNGTGKAKP